MSKDFSPLCPGSTYQTLYFSQGYALLIQVKQQPKNMFPGTTVKLQSFSNNLALVRHTTFECYVFIQPFDPCEFVSCTTEMSILSKSSLYLGRPKLESGTMSKTRSFVYRSRLLTTEEKDNNLFFLYYFHETH